MTCEKILSGLRHLEGVFTRVHFGALSNRLHGPVLKDMPSEAALFGDASSQGCWSWRSQSVRGLGHFNLHGLLILELRRLYEQTPLLLLIYYPSPNSV